MSLLFEKVVIPPNVKEPVKLFPFVSKYIKSLNTYLLCIRRIYKTTKGYTNVFSTILYYLAEEMYISDKREFKNSFDYMNYWIGNPLIQKYNPLVATKETDNSLNGLACLFYLSDCSKSTLLFVNSLGISKKIDKLYKYENAPSELTTNLQCAMLVPLEVCNITIPKTIPLKSKYMYDYALGFSIPDSEMTNLDFISVTMHDTDFFVDFSTCVEIDCINCNLQKTEINLDTPFDRTRHKVYFIKCNDKSSIIPYAAVYGGNQNITIIPKLNRSVDLSNIQIIHICMDYSLRCMDSEEYIARMIATQQKTKKL